MCLRVCEKTNKDSEEWGRCNKLKGLFCLLRWALKRFLKRGHLKNTLWLSRLIQIRVEQQTVGVGGESRSWNNRLGKRTMWVDRIPFKINYACRTMKLFPFYSLSFIQSFTATKRGWCKEKITCPLSRETMHLVVLESDNFNLINCWFFCPLFNYDSEPPLWKQGQVCNITPDMVVLVHPL